jgi:ABC-type uncharacterized transport system involved in gliding motility auxiliary subunit
MAEETSRIIYRRRMALFSLTGAGLIIGSLLLINFIFSYLPLRLDTSQGRAYSLSRGSKLLLKELEDPLIVRIMFSSNLPAQFRLTERYVRDIFSEYQKSSHGKMRIEYIDPLSSPKAKQDAMQAGVMPVQVDVREKDRREVKEAYMGVSLIYGDQKEALPFIQDAQGLEYEITQKIKKLIHPGQIKVGLVSNAKALTFSSDSLKPLGQAVSQMYTAMPVDLNGPIPTDIKSLWLVGPTEQLDSTSIVKLRGWVQNGGTLGLLVDRYSIDVQTFRPTPLETNIDSLLKEWGIDFRRALIVDPSCDRIQIRSQQGIFSMINVIDYPYFPFITDVNRSHPATKPIDGFSLPFVSPLIIDKSLPGFTYTTLAKTSNRSWLDPQAYNVSPLDSHERPVESPTGPFNVGLLIEGPFGAAAGVPGKTGRVIVFGCSRFIRTDYPPRQSNYTLFLNLLDWSAQDEFLLSIRSKGVAHRPLKNISDSMRMLLKYVLICALPIFSLVIGLIVWNRQKRRLQLMPLKYHDA